MFIRLKRAKTKRGESIRAVLVKAARIDGKPRQKVLRHLATILAKHSDATAHRDWFWRRIDWHLCDLNLIPADKKSITSKLEAQFPRPTDAQLEKLKRERHLMGTGVWEGLSEEWLNTTSQSLALQAIILFAVTCGCLHKTMNWANRVSEESPMGHPGWSVKDLWF